MPKTMSDIIANLFVDIPPSKAKLTLFLDNNCFLIASTVCVSSLWKMVLRVLVEGNTKLLLMHCMNVAAQCLILHSMQCEPKQNLT
jgi:hypothetical protein